MSTWHATLTYTLAVEADVATLSRSLAAHHGRATRDGTTLCIDLSLGPADIRSFPAAAQLAIYLARRALFDAELVVTAQDGLSVVRVPSVGAVEPRVRFDEV
jgi:hypothetical protein